MKLALDLLGKLATALRTERAVPSTLPEARAAVVHASLRPQRPAIPRRPVQLSGQYLGNPPVLA